MAPFDPQKHHRRSMRLKGYNYARPGAYFITLVTYHRENIFGQIVNGEMQMSALGQIARDEWIRSAGLRREICLNEDEFVIMPNHLHGIVWIVDPSELDGPIDPVGAHGVRPDGVRPDGVRPDGVRPNHVRPDAVDPNATRPFDAHRVGAHGVRPDDVRPDGVNPDGVNPDAVRPGSVGEKGGRRPPLPKRLPRSLSSFVAGFKSAVTSRARRELAMSGIWQRNYYDHIIRSEREFPRIWDYIDTNPQRWEEDQLNPSAPANRYNQG